MKLELDTDQNNYIKQLTHMPQALILGPVGIGKTVVALTAATKFPVLVVAPYYVALNGWSDEIKKWPHLENLKASVVMGPVEERAVALYSNADVYIINYENLPWLADQHLPVFGTVIMDEITWLKETSGAWHKSMRTIRAEYRWGITATPISTTLLDLFGQVRVLGARSLGRNLVAYKQKYFRARGTRHCELCFGAEEEIYEAIKPICLRLPHTVYKEKEVRNVYKYVNLPKHAWEVYSQAKEDLAIELQDRSVDIETPAILTGKLMQIASGAVYLSDGEEKESRYIHAAKMKALWEIVKSLQDEPAVITYTYRHEADRIKKMFPEAKMLTGVKGVEATRLITRFNKGKIPLLLLHPESSGEGINIQHGCHNIIYFSGVWSQKVRTQTTGRLARRGQKYTVNAHHIVVLNTVEERQRDICEGRIELNREVLEAMTI